MTPFDTPGNKLFENTVGKGEIARNGLNNFLPFFQILKCRLQRLSIWKSLKFVVW